MVPQVIFGKLILEIRGMYENRGRSGTLPLRFSFCVFQKWICE